MRFEEDNPNYAKAVRAFFAILKDRPFHSICAIDDDGTILGGCAFSPVVNGMTTCYLLALDKRWATKEIYSKIQGYPFLTLGAEKVIGRVKLGTPSAEIALKNGGELQPDGHTIIFTKEKTMEVMKDPVVC